MSQPSHCLLFLIFGVAVVINLVWEMGQMFAYQPCAASPIQAWLICGVASSGDAIYIISLYWLGRLTTRDWRWMAHLNSKRILAIIGAGLMSATLIEWIALRMGQWNYSEAMIRLPLLEVGLLPVLQLMTLPILTFWIVGRMTQPKRI